MAVWRANMATLHVLLDVRFGKWLCITWFLINVLKAQGTASLSDSIVTKARCIANCYTMTGSQNNDSEKTCQTTACQECLSPCENWESSMTEMQCLQTCLNSSSCKSSCRFLTHIRNFSSVLHGDGSTPPTPGIPTVTNKTFTSISLKWDPVRNTTGTAVYLMVMSITGDKDLTQYFSQVFTMPQAVIKTSLLCAPVDKGNPIQRSTFDGLSYKFHIAVLTENSSISYGTETTNISLPQPGPVSNITSPSFEYEGARLQSKLKLTVSWTPPEQSQHVSSYAIIWNHILCRIKQAAPVSPQLTRTELVNLVPRAHVSFGQHQDTELWNNPFPETKILGLPVSRRMRALVYMASRDKFDVDAFHKSIQCALERLGKSTFGFEITAVSKFKSKRHVDSGNELVDYSRAPCLGADQKTHGLWERDCQLSPQPSGSFNLNEELERCNYTLKVYALSRCIPSSVTMITQEYPGCRNITSYPKDLCHKFDPPDSPGDSRKVRNVSYTLTSADDAYRFNINVTWDPPIYPYKQLDYYGVIWERRGAPFWEFPELRKSYVASYLVGPLRPGEIYDVRLKPNFEDSAPYGKEIEFSVSTPPIDPHDVTVRDLAVNDFTFSPQTGKFDLNITWLKPSFNYSQMSSYTLSYQVNGGNKIKSSTDKPYYTIYGISHGEPVAFNITPKYNPLHFWIKGEDTMAKSRAPDPDPSQVTVRDLMLNDFTFKLETYSLNVTWYKPSFKYSNITSYTISYRLDNGRENKTETSKTYFNIDGISHGQPVAFNVTPHYINTRIRAVTSVMKTKGPVPPNEEISVQQLQQTGDFVEDKQSNTFAVNFTWKPPSFQHRDVLYYNLSYEFSGYPRDQLPCSSLVKGPRCTITGVKDTRFQVSGILPQDRVIIEVTPVYNDKYISGKKEDTEDRAPGPREELLKVVGLSHDALVPSSNELFRTKVSWQKPLFKHSEVSYYSFKITNGTERIVGNVQRRAIDFNTVSTTIYTNVTIDGIQLGKAIEFKVTPVFVVYMVPGREASIAILQTEIAGEQISSSMTPGETAGLVIGLLLLILIVICSMIWCHIERQRKMEAKGLISGKNALMIDHWEVDGNLVCLEEELGEGAFGKVYKGAVKELTPFSRLPSLKTPMNTSRTATIKGNEIFTVAVKMLHNMADGDQRREFLEEIQLMKAVGSHKNIVNMLGCCTVEEPMFLLVEYVPCGDLLHYLRKHRSKVKEYLGDDSRGPYRSTYCETYFTDGSPTGISVKTTKSDRIYVNAPDMPKEKNGDIQLLSFNSHNADGPETGEENKGLDSQEKEHEPDKNEEFLTPGDLMAFAWQISQAMEYLAKKGFVHRDLAARNVLVGEKKIAKVADFGLTRHVYEEKVYYAKRNRKLPLKWMSIEAIFDQTFTAQSDVWAFGVVLWELVTLGGTPYPAIDNKELLGLLKDGYRMEKPDTCNHELYNMMMDCWKKCPEARPTFTEIRHKLEEMMQKDNPYLDLSALDESKEYYNVPSFNSLMEESTDDLFDKDDQECRQDSDENKELGNKKRTGNSNGYDREREEKKNTKNTIAYDGCGKIDDRGVKKCDDQF